MDNEQPIPNDLFRDGVNKLVNQWFRRWRDARLAEQSDWDTCISELTEIGHECPYALIAEIGAALVAELERRNPKP